MACLMIRILETVAVVTMVTTGLYWNLTTPIFTRKVDKYLAFRFNAARIGNQMFRLVSGYNIAKRLGRKLFFVLRGHGDESSVRRMLARITEAFPRTFQVYTIFSTCVKSKVVPFAYDPNGRSFCCAYEDPLRYACNYAKYLVLDTEYGQNVRYFEDNIKDVREMLTFSSELQERGNKRVDRLNITIDGAMCVHIRRTDFIIYKAATKSSETLDAAAQIAKKYNLHQYLLFGDDQLFMKYLAGNLTELVENSRTEVLHFDEFEEFFISSRLCNAFLLSAPTSTFGWWLAFFARNQNAVYYLNDDRPLMRKVPTKELFL